MASISVSLNGKAIPVEVLDYFVSGGIRYASIEALEGKPFMGGDKWPVHTPWATVKVADLDLEPDECTCLPDGDACPACVAANRLRYGDDFPFVRSSK